MADRDLVLSACDECGKRIFCFEGSNGTDRFSELSGLIEAVAAEMKPKRHHIRITFRSETLIVYEKGTGELYRAHPLTTHEQNTVWNELLRHFPQRSADS